MEQIMCPQCGRTFKCTTGAAIHALINHMGRDMHLYPENITLACYDCLWATTMPFKFKVMGGRSVRIAVLPHGHEAVLPY